MIAVCTEWGSNYKDIADITLPVFRKYCEKHGYMFFELELANGGNDYAYKKHELFRELFKQKDIEAIWYLDVDALIMNHAIKIESFIDDKHSFYITRDFNELNGGSVIIVNNHEGRLFNDIILGLRNEYPCEQNVYNDSPAIIVSDDMEILKHPSINSYQYDLYPECRLFVGREDLGDWRKGNFVLHVPGLGIEKRKEVLQNHLKDIIYE